MKRIGRKQSEITAVCEDGEVKAGDTVYFAVGRKTYMKLQITEIEQHDGYRLQPNTNFGSAFLKVIAFCDVIRKEEIKIGSIVCWILDNVYKVDPNAKPNDVDYYLTGTRDINWFAVLNNTKMIDRLMEETFESYLLHGDRRRYETHNRSAATE